MIKNAKWLIQLICRYLKYLCLLQLNSNLIIYTHDVFMIHLHLTSCRDECVETWEEAQVKRKRGRVQITGEEEGERERGRKKVNVSCANLDTVGSLSN